MWPRLLNDTVLGMLKNCVERYAEATPAPQSRDSNVAPSFGSKAAAPTDIVAPTPTFFGSVSQTQGKAQPKMQFDDATVTKG